MLSNGWDDATAALQLLSHLEGDVLNVAQLVPMSRTIDGSLRKRLGRWGKIPPYLP